MSVVRVLFFFGFFWKMSCDITVCLLGTRPFPCRKDLFTGWCGRLPEHRLSLPFSVRGLNQRKCLKRIDLNQWNYWQNTFVTKFTNNFPFFRLSEDRYPKLAAYYNSLKERPSIKTSWPPTWLETPDETGKLKDIWDSNLLRLTHKNYIPSVPSPWIAWF